MQVYQAINYPNSAPTYFGSVIDTCKQILANMFECKVACVRRSANNVAHALARASCSYAVAQFFGGPILCFYVICYPFKPINKNPFIP